MHPEKRPFGVEAFYSARELRRCRDGSARGKTRSGGRLGAWAVPRGPCAGRAYEGVGRGSEAATALQEPTRGSAESGAADGTDAATPSSSAARRFDRFSGSDEKSSNFIQKAPPAFAPIKNETAVNPFLRRACRP